jgi:hypothetical protein
VCQQLTPVILATWEAEIFEAKIWRITARAQSSQDPISTTKLWWEAVIGRIMVSGRSGQKRFATPHLNKGWEED